MNETSVAVQSESRDAKLARLRREADERASGREDQKKDREIERLELAAKYERELGPEGSEFLIYDSGHLSDPLFVVKRGALIQFTKYEESKHTHADRFDFIAPSMVHPPPEQFAAALNQRVGVGVEIANRLAKLFGLAVEIDRGK